MRSDREMNRKATRRNRGTSMVEAVFVLPLLLLMLFGIAEFGLLFAQWQTVNNAAREGARIGVLFRDPAVCAASAATDVTTTVNNYLGAMGIPTPTITTTAICQPAGTPFTVTVSVPYNFRVLPGIMGFFGATTGPSVNLVGVSTMRQEG